MADLSESKADTGGIDDMDRFAEECAKRLAAEHERIAAESAKNADDDMPLDALDDEPGGSDDDMPLDALDDEPGGSDDDMPLDALDDEPEKNAPGTAEDLTQSSESNAETAVKSDVVRQTDSADDLSRLMKTEEYQQQRHEDESETEDEDSDKLPTWLRLLFSVVLLVLGAAGIWILVSGEGLSFFSESLCFMEVALCLLIAVGLNASVMSDHKLKKNIMRTALWFIFIFYCLNAADKLFLHNMIKNGFVPGDFAQYAQNNINFDIFGGLSEMTGMDILQMVLYITPYTFCVPVLMKSYRNIVLYFLYMTFSFMAVSTLQIISMSSAVSLTRCLVCLGGAAAVYIIVMLPPVQNGLRRVGLLEWAELEEDDD